MHGKLVYLICITLSIVYSIMSAVIESTSVLVKQSNKRESRSPRCRGSKCGTLVENHQVFLAPVTFNTYIIQAGARCASDNCNRVLDKRGIIQPPIKVTPATTPPPPSSKTKVFEVEFNMEDFKSFDLYILQDGTETFNEHRAQLAKMAPQLIQALQNLSPDFQLGYGAYGDKYRFSSHKWGFRNLMPLTKDTSRFAKVVTFSDYLYGGDNRPEDPLTAIHQIGVCSKDIKWRTNVTRLLLVTTDKEFQTPIYNNPKFNLKDFDGSKCIMENGVVNGSTYVWQQNYPTLEDMIKTLKENTIKVVFGIAKSSRVGGEPTVSIRERYKQLAQDLDPAPVVLNLQDKSANIIELVQEAVKQVKNPLRIETTLHGPQALIDQIIVTAKCKDRPRVRNYSSRLTDDSMCKVPKNNIVKYRITVSLPCNLNISDVTLKYNLQGHSMSKMVDLNSVCN